MNSSPSGSEEPPEAWPDTPSRTGCWPDTHAPRIPRRNVRRQCRGVAADRHSARRLSSSAAAWLLVVGFCGGFTTLLDLLGRCRAAAAGRGFRTGCGLHDPEHCGMSRLYRRGHVAREPDEGLAHPGRPLRLRSGAGRPGRQEGAGGWQEGVGQEGRPGRKMQDWKAEPGRKRAGHGEVKI